MRRVITFLAIAAFLLALGALVAARLDAFKGTVPNDLGVNQGQLKPPSATSNSVSSQAGLYPDHPQHTQAQIDPLALRGDGPATLQKIQTIVRATPGAVIIGHTPDYVYAQYTSRLMRYVDDVEFWFDPARQVIQVRSASRVGRKDLGANRARIEAIRVALAATPV